MPENRAFTGFFRVKIARMDTLYRYRLFVAKSSKCPNIREYSNCCRPVHHQKSISKFSEKDGLVPCAEDSDWQGKEMYLFCSTLLCMKRMSVGVYETDELLDCGLQV